MNDSNLQQQDVSAWNKCPDLALTESWNIAKLADQAILDGKSSDEFIIECASNGISCSAEQLSSAYDFSSAMRRFPLTFKLLSQMFSTVVNEAIN